MKLNFKKEGKNNIVEIITSEGKTLDFDYIEMVRQIFKDKGIEEPKISSDYLAEEVESIESLIFEISESLNPLFQEPEEDLHESERDD